MHRNTRRNTRKHTHNEAHTTTRTHAKMHTHMHTHTRPIVPWTDTLWLEDSDRCHQTVFTLIFVVLVRAMPTLSVIRASGEEVLPDFFVEADGSLRELARAAAARLAVVPSRCVLLSPAGYRMAHTQTPSDEKLVDGDVITVLVVAAPRVFAHPWWCSFRCRQRRWLRRDVGRRLTFGGDSENVRQDWRCRACRRQRFRPSKMTVHRHVGRRKLWRRRRRQVRVARRCSPCRRQRIRIRRSQGRRLRGHMGQRT